MVLTFFELFKVSIEIAIKKKRLSIDVLREKKSAGVAPSDTIRCHTCSQQNVSSSTQPVAGTSPHAIRTVQQRLHKQGQWIRAKRAEQNEKEFLDRFIQVPEQKCRPFRWSEDEAR
jgi:hypothetical protein